VKYNIYNVFSTIHLDVEILLQSMSFSHTYSELVCGVPTEAVNDELLANTRDTNAGYYVIQPTITMVSSNDFFRDTIHDDKKDIPLLPVVKVEALFECHTQFKSTYLNIIWFQDAISKGISSEIKKKIEKVDWFHYAKEFTL